MLVDDQVTLAVQVNGKLRDTLNAPRGLDRAAAEALALGSEKVQRQLDGNAPRKVIVVPDRLVNIVACAAALRPAASPCAAASS